MPCLAAVASRMQLTNLGPLSVLEWSQMATDRPGHIHKFPSVYDFVQDCPSPEGSKGVAMGLEESEHYGLILEPKEEAGRPGLPQPSSCKNCEA